MKVHDTVLDKFIDFCIDIKFNAGVVFFGMYLGQGDFLLSLKAWCQTYITSDFTFGQFLLIMLCCKLAIKTAKGMRNDKDFNIQREFYDFLVEVVTYGSIIVAVHGISSASIDGVKIKEFNTIPRIVLGACLALEFKNVLKAAGLNLSKLIDDFTGFAGKFKQKNDE